MAKKQKLTVCRSCNAPIARDAKTCPSCGAKNKKPFYKKWWIILLIIILIGFMGRDKKEKIEEFDWNEVELNDRLPKPNSHLGKIIFNNSDDLDMNVEISKNDYKVYIEECQAKGYNIESERIGDSYTAFDKEGYNLRLSYIGETMSISLDAPIKLETLKWPKSEIAGLLPMPKSTIGKVSIDTTNRCYIYVGESSIDDFNAYADICYDSGFSVDYERGEKSYNAKDADGNELFLSYEGNEVMTVEIKKISEEDRTETEESEQTVETETEESEQTVETETEEESEQFEETEAEQESELSLETEIKDTEKTNELVDGMRPEFKEAMDSYEEFINEYCEFMKKYAESDGNDLELVKDYSEYLSKYRKALKAFEAWDSEEMNAAELSYYSDVQIRVSKKLFEAALQ